MENKREIKWKKEMVKRNLATLNKENEVDSDKEASAGKRFKPAACQLYGILANTSGWSTQT